MLPGIGSRKRDVMPSVMGGRSTDGLPQLSNEMQLCIMNKVKSGELSIEDALDQARRGSKQQQSLIEGSQQVRQYNFSVHKHNRYRWQKRVLQIDFKTKVLCSIEKGIVKRQLAFSRVKSCEDGVGSRFSISFKERHDYELEATSLEDKQKMMQLVNQIIYGNIYSQPAEGDIEATQKPLAPKCFRKGTLLLHRGGLASFKWLRYEALLHPGSLTLVPQGSDGRPMAADEEGPTAALTPIIIHLSDCNSIMEKSKLGDAFTVITHKNEYQFRVPVTDTMKSPESLQKERDSWIQAINKLCVDWTCRYQAEQGHWDPDAMQSLVETNEKEFDFKVREGVLDLIPGVENHVQSVYQNQSPSSGSEPVPKPRALVKSSDAVPGSPHTVSTSPVCSQSSTVGPPGQSPTSSPTTNSSRLHAVPSSFPVPSSPTSFPVPSSTSFPVLSSPTTFPVPSAPISFPVPSSPTSKLKFQSSPSMPAWSSSSQAPSSLKTDAAAAPSAPLPLPDPVSLSSLAPYAPCIPLPPPLPSKVKVQPCSMKTKAFHWDLVPADKIENSFWKTGRNRKIEMDTSRLNDHFAVRDLGTVGAKDSNHNLSIMLNQKIAHNFNIFLKSFHLRPEELKDKLFIVNEDDGGLSDEHITSLRRYVPTLGDVEMYKSFDGPVSELHIVDQYMLEMCKIPFLSARLDLLLTLRDLPASISDLLPLINQKIRMCMQLCGSGSFVSVLEYLLAIGNYLNENAGKEKAKGFRLSSLTKLSQLRGKDRKYTLMHALVEQIMLQEPGLATFFQELAEFETVPGASIKGLTAEVDVVKNELQKVIQYRKTYMKKYLAVQHIRFSKDLKVAIEKYNSELSLLTKRCEGMKKLYADILVKFGEPMDQDSQELFGLVCTFISDFKRAYADIM